MDKYADILKKYNYTPKNYSVNGGVPSESGAGRVAEAEAYWSGTSNSKTTKPITEKIADITGGKEVAQGLGQALANREVSKSVEETQNQQIKIQGDLLGRIKEKKALGQDTSRLENALELLNQDLQETSSGAEKLLNQNELTGKEVLGDALQLATTAGGAKIAGGVVGKAKQATSVLRGLAQGAKAGALGGSAVGALSGASQGLQDNKDTKGIAKDALRGGVVGGVGGALVGGVTGGISGKIAGKQAREQEKILKNITPDVSDIKPKEYERLLAQGRIEPKSATSKASYILSDAQKETALKYSNLIKKDPVKTSINISDEIGRQDADVGNFLRKNNGIFSKGELKNYLSKSIKDISDVGTDDKILSKNKTKFVKGFVDSISKNDMETLWQSRKNFDQQIEKAFGSSSISSKLKVELRNAVQDFISDRTDDVTYKASMKEMSKLFKLRDVVTTKAVKERGKSALELWIKNNPTVAKALGIAGAGVLANEFIGQ